MSRFWDYLLILNVCLVLLGCDLAYGYKVPQNSVNTIDSPNQIENVKHAALEAFQETSSRRKRELEMMENEGLDYPMSENQEDGSDEGFWDKVVKVALKMFNRFVQWLNSSE